MRRVIPFHLESRVVTAAVTMGQIEEPAELFMGLGVSRTLQTQASGVWKDLHWEIKPVWVHQVMKARIATLLVSLCLSTWSMIHHLIVNLCLIRQVHYLQKFIGFSLHDLSLLWHTFEILLPTDFSSCFSVSRAEDIQELRSITFELDFCSMVCLWRLSCFLNL